MRYFGGYSWVLVLCNVLQYSAMSTKVLWKFMHDTLKYTVQYVLKRLATKIEGKNRNMYS